MTPHEFQALIEKYIDPYTVMLVIMSTRNPAATDVVTNGTGSLVYTGTKDLLITNYHVYDAFLSYRQSVPDAILAMSGVHGSRFLDISTADVLGRDKDLDLAVLHIPSRHVSQQGKRFAVITPWPPRRPEVGMLAILYGYPGEGRAPEGVVLGASHICIALPVVSVSDRHFLICDENQDAHVLIPDGQTPLTNFGGISGSAVYAIPNKMSANQDAVGLCGFAYEASESGAIFVSHADHINADGSIH